MKGALNIAIIKVWGKRITIFIILAIVVPSSWIVWLVLPVMARYLIYTHRCEIRF